jgi:hypothetical protein
MQNTDSYDELLWARTFVNRAVADNVNDYVWDSIECAVSDEVWNLIDQTIRRPISPVRDPVWSSVLQYFYDYVKHLR